MKTIHKLMFLVGAVDGYLVWWSQGKFALWIYENILKSFVACPMSRQAMFAYILVIGLIWLGVSIAIEKYIKINGAGK